MAKLIYAEPDDEITNLVDRLRSEKSEKELIFVLPPASRVMQSGLNARLLMQYSNSLGKSTAVVSSDPRSQGTAIETGFTVYPTLTDYESRRSIDRAVQPAVNPAPAVDDFPPIDNAAPPPTTTRRADLPKPVTTPRPRPVAAGRVATSARRSYLPWILGAVGVLVIALILFLFVLPSATVTIITSARSVAATPTVTGSTSPPGSSDQLAVQTTVQQAQESTSQQRNATGKKDIAAVAATGQVVFHNGTTISTVKIPSGVELFTDDAKKFVTTQDSDTMNPGQDSAPVNVVARGGGTAGNVAAGTIKHITNNTDPSITVTNPQPTSNGADATQKQVVSQTDLDTAKKELGDQLEQKVRDSLKQKAGGQKIIDETQSISRDANYDHKAGDEAGNFNANVTVKGQATTFDEGKMKDVLLGALKRQAPGGYALTDDPPKYDYHVAQKDDKGKVIWDASASAFMAAAVNKDDLRSHITGQSGQKAKAYIQGHIDASDVVVRQSPSFIPWLPFIGGRIDIKEQVQNNTPQ
jgi:hypothetical protein